MRKVSLDDNIVLVFHCMHDMYSSSKLCFTEDWEEIYFCCINMKKNDSFSMHTHHLLQTYFIPSFFTKVEREVEQ